jgi:hypothetical protein
VREIETRLTANGCQWGIFGINKKMQKSLVPFLRPVFENNNPKSFVRKGTVNSSISPFPDFSVAHKGKSVFSFVSHIPF